MSIPYRSVVTVPIAQNPLTPIAPDKVPLEFKGDLSRDRIPIDASRQFAALVKLPVAFDDITGQLSHKAYQEMLYDEEVASAVKVLTMGILSRGIEISPQPNCYNEEEREIAARIANECRWAIDNYPNLILTLQEMLDYIPFGSSLAVVEWGTVPMRDKIRLTFTAINKKPIGTFQYFVDSNNKLLGVVSTALANNLSNNTYYAMAQAQVDRSNYVPVQQLLHFSSSALDPRGNSYLRAAYASWWLKQAVLNYLSKFLANFATPAIWGTVPKDAADVCKQDADGNIIATLSATEALAEALAEFQANSYGAFPAETHIATVNFSDNGSIFRLVLEMMNRAIVRAILSQSLATSEGEHQSRAAAETHQDIASLHILQNRMLVSDVITTQLLKPFVRYNWGEQYVHLTPKVDLGSGSGFPLSLEGVATLARSGWPFTPEQVEKINNLIGIPQ